MHDAEADFDATVLAVRERLSVRRYGAGEWPLFAIEACVRRDGPSRVHLSIDGLIVDGHSIALLLHQWARCYADPQVPLPEPELTARDCLQALYRQRDTADFRADLGYWAGRLRDLPPGPVAGSGDGGWARQPFTATVPAAQWQALRDRATELDVTPTSLLLNVFAEVLARAGAAQPFSVVVTTNDRLRLPSGAAGVVGLDDVFRLVGLPEQVEDLVVEFVSASVASAAMGTHP